MATALDLLMSTKEDVNLLSEESDICTIDAKTRVIFVPSTIVVGGVQSDKNAERIKFSCPKIVGDNLDLSKFSVRINFENVSSVDFNVSIKDQYICDDVAVDGENVTFSWLIGRNAARYMGTVRFIVCAVKTDSDSNISVEWNTTIAEVPVLEGIEIDQPQIGKEEKDVINQLLELTKNTSSEAVQNVNSAKEQAIKDIQSVSQPDTTLTIEGGLAEAKATGEAIGSLKEDLSSVFIMVNKSKIEQGSWENGNKTETNRRIRYGKKIPVKAGDNISYYCNGLYILIDVYDENAVLKETTGFITDTSISNVYTIKNDGFLYLGFANGSNWSDSTEIFPQDFNCTVIIAKQKTFAFDSTVYEIKNSIENLKAVVYNSENGTVLDLGNFVSGGIDGVTYNPNIKYRCVSENILFSKRDIKMTAKTGFRFGFTTCTETGENPVWSNWTTNSYTIPKNTFFKVQIARVSEKKSEIADVLEFTSAIIIDTRFDSVDNSAESSKTVQYIGEKIPSKVLGFDFNKILTMSYSGSELTSQDIEVYGNYLFVTFTGIEQIRVYDLLSKKHISSMEVNVRHGAGIQFSKEFYFEDDTYPLLYSGGDSSNQIVVIRITNNADVWSAEVVKTIYIPTTNGYYPSPSLDADNKVMYTYAHSEASNYPKKMIIAKWDLNKLTQNEDGTFTPRFISQCESPRIGTYQGHKYFGGKIYLGVSNTSTPHNCKFSVIDASTGDVLTVIDMSPVTESENEGLCYKIEGNEITWLYSDYYDVFELKF